MCAVKARILRVADFYVQTTGAENLLRKPEDASIAKGQSLVCDGDAHEIQECWSLLTRDSLRSFCAILAVFISTLVTKNLWFQK